MHSLVYLPAGHPFFDSMNLRRCLDHNRECQQYQ